jgi:hypothetical protein
MHHCVGKFSLLSTAQGGRKTSLFSDYRGGLFKIGENYFGCLIEIIDQTELKPGETAHVRITFQALKALNLITSHIQLGCSYEVCEGAKVIGSLLIEDGNQEKTSG